MQSKQMLEQLLAKLQGNAAYSRMPPRLETLYPDVARKQRDDVHGVVARLQAMQTVLRGRNLGSITDLAGNSGYFCMSLVDGGMASNATVYDILTDTLAAGRQMAELLGISDKMRFIEQPLDLPFVQGLPKSDTFICLNLLHHAGLLFDVERVRAMGWAAYVQKWLEAMHEKGQVAIIGLSFDAASPVAWEGPPETRPQRFAAIAQAAGWSVRYYANVGELARRGVEAANGRYVGQSRAPNEGFNGALFKLANSKPLQPIKEFLKNVLRKFGLLQKIQNMTGSLQLYHIYILERA